MVAVRRGLRAQALDQIFNDVDPDEELERIIEVTHPVHVAARRIDDALNAERQEDRGKLRSQLSCARQARSRAGNRFRAAKSVMSIYFGKNASQVAHCGRLNARVKSITGRAPAIDNAVTATHTDGRSGMVNRVCVAEHADG